MNGGKIITAERSPETVVNIYCMSEKIFCSRKGKERLKVFFCIFKAFRGRFGNVIGDLYPLFRIFLCILRRLQDTLGINIGRHSILLFGFTNYNHCTEVYKTIFTFAKQEEFGERYMQSIMLLFLPCVCLVGLWAMYLKNSLTIFDQTSHDDWFILIFKMGYIMVPLSERLMSGMDIFFGVF